MPRLKRGSLTEFGLINWPFGTRPKRRPSSRWLFHSPASYPSQGIRNSRFSAHAVFVAHARPSSIQSEEVERRNLFLPTRFCLAILLPREDCVRRFTPVVLASSPGLAFGIVRTGRFVLLFFATLKSGSVRWHDVFCRRAFIPRYQPEFNLLTFRKRLKPLTSNFTVMDEHIVPVFLCDKAVAFSLVEPLYCSVMPLGPPVPSSPPEDWDANSCSDCN